MSKVIFLYFSLLFSFYACGQFEKFKTGKFEMINDGKTYVVDRRKDYQIERIKGVKGFLKYKVVWLDEKVYKLTYESGKFENLIEEYSTFTNPIIIELYKTDGVFCYFKAYYNKEVFYDKFRKVN